ncbi:hypothetical protein bcgnr5378_38100 [Bacillus cereus]|uniref:Uncharacterized protein n=1 Tax=Bacillus cereus TaxID=1396 RepID=A0A161R6K9_BACCE|nr:hypothetical protein [Bacillus cereus]KZD71861.1 hypothetical protein B4088_0322 [Bacillus cereus]
MYLKNEFEGKYGVEYDECKSKECSIFDALIERIRTGHNSNHELYAENFSRGVWVKFSLNEKKMLLRGFANYIGNVMRLKCVPFVHLVEMEDHVYGLLDTDYYVIRINKKQIEDGVCLASTVIFELAHAYQLQLVKEVADIESECHNMDRSSDGIFKKVSTFLSLPDAKFIDEKLMRFSVSQGVLATEQYIDKLIEFNSLNIELTISELMFKKVTEIQKMKISGYSKQA